MADRKKNHTKPGIASLLVLLMTVPTVFAESEPSPFYCFEVNFPDGDRNSECVRRERAACERSMESMRSRAWQGSVFKGCFIPARVFCYDVKYGGGSLCFTDLSDCEASHKVIPGGACAASE